MNGFARRFIASSQVRAVLAGSLWQGKPIELVPADAGADPARIVPLPDGETLVLRPADHPPEMIGLLRESLRQLASYEFEAQDLGQELSMVYEELTLVYRLAEAFCGTLRLEEIQTRAVREIAETLEVKRVSLLRLDESAAENGMPAGKPSRGLILAAGRGVRAEHLGTMRFPEGKGLPWRVLREGRSLIANDISRFPEYEPAGLDERNLLLVPIPSKRGLIGVLAVSDHEDGAEFTSKDEKLLTSLATQVGSAWENARLYGETRELFLNTIEALAAAVDAKDPYTHGHSRRVTDFSVAIAEEMGLAVQDVENIRVAGLLHDIGKIGIAESILRKPDRLTREEFDEIKKHPPIGAEILGKVRNLTRYIPGMVDHHEKFDGSGYPLGRAGTEISLAGRIIAVADTFDAITSNRPYHPDCKGKPDEVALGELERCSGKHFDPDVVRAFRQAYDHGRIISHGRETELAARNTAHTT